jgi:hypothetical protein
LQLREVADFHSRCSLSKDLAVSHLSSVLVFSYVERKKEILSETKGSLSVARKS